MAQSFEQKNGNNYVGYVFSFKFLEIVTGTF